LGDTARALGAAAEAAGRYAESLALFHEIGNQWGSAAALLNLGRLALDHQADAAAARLLHAALELALDTSSAPQVAAIVSTFAQLVERARERGWAAVLAQLAASEPGALDRSQVHITRLLGWSKAGGPAETMSLEQAIAVACAAPTQARTAAPMALQPPANGPTYPAGLTAREVEVLRLVAQGLTDAQVAERLVVSRRTVHAHLASIYGKIQVNSRSAATRFAVEQSLL
jgi:DNA-binding NarL/FixJ family response regulator